MRKIRLLLLMLLAAFANAASAQNVTGITPDHVYMNNIKTIKLNLKGSPLTFPVIALNGNDVLELDFDDLDGDIKNYYYSWILCNADWSPSNLNPFDYIKGFTENRISDYHYSTIPYQHYTHYKVSLPNNNCYPTHSGNFLLKVYLNNDTSQLAFTRRIMVVDTKIQLQAKIAQPVNPKLFKTYQKIDFSINTSGLNITNPFEQIKVIILQNYRWDNAIRNLRPTFIKGPVLEYNTESDGVFPAMKEWRWVDLRSFRLQTARVANAIYTRDSTSVYVAPDEDRVNKQYIYLKDINGRFIPSTLNDYNPDYEADYAMVHFTFPAKEPYLGSSLYIFGELTNYECGESNKMTYNAKKGAYEGQLFLKQGYYNYIYGTVDDNGHVLNTDNTEGNWWETENDYTILVYYRSLGGRADQLVGARTINSLRNR